MLLTHLSLTNFRLFSRLDLDVPGGPVLLVGGNAQGKTTLLEAVYYLATFDSFHASNDRQLISFFTEREALAVTRIVADFRYTATPGQQPGRLSSRRLEIRLIREGLAQDGTQRFRKEILLDGVARKAGEALGAFNAVLFLPHMMRVVDGGPDERRRYLNMTLGQALPRYANTWSEYQQVLAQRNALLKALAERSGDPAQLDYWDAKLARSGAELIYARLHAVQELERHAARLHTDLTRGQEVLRLEYLPAYDPLEALNGRTPTGKTQMMFPERSGLSVDQICHGFQERLGRLRGEEIGRGVTTIGPHRDDLRFLANGIDLGIYGSRGQGRTAVLALKLAEVAWMKEKTGQWPVLLLDEVLAELDPERRSDLLQRLLAFEQALLTTTDLDQFSESYSQQARLWRIQAGQVSV